MWHVLQRQAAQSAAAAAKAQPGSGLPAGLKAGVEQLSGIKMDDVRVHRDSPEPAKVGALAFARGHDIHLAAGQEKHLPHEAWHVVQQAQGRVKATMQMKDGVPVNDDPALESEADAMGARAAKTPAASIGSAPSGGLQRLADPAGAVAQRNGDMAIDYEDTSDLIDDYHADDPETGNAEEELVSGDLVVSQFDTEQQAQLAQALAGRTRHHDIVEDFRALTSGGHIAFTAKNFLDWFNAPHVTRRQFKEGRLQSQPQSENVVMQDVVQRARGAGDSFQAGYQTSTHGQFTNVTYSRGGNGAIDFAAVKSHTSWSNPVKPSSGVQLTTGSSTTTHGITLNGTKVRIAGASRGTHFSIANRIMKNGCGSTSPANWTWHHLPQHYRMVLVDRVVHSKHGHNGGVHLWT